MNRSWNLLSRPTFPLSAGCVEALKSCAVSRDGGCLKALYLPRKLCKYVTQRLASPIPRNSYVDQHSVDSGTFHDEQPMSGLMPLCSSEHYSTTIYLDSMA